MMRTWWSDRPLRLKLATLVAAGTIGMLALGYLHISALSDAGDRNAALLHSSTVVGLSLEADMMHDAVRGDVLQALLSGTDPAAQSSPSDLAEHSAKLRDTLAAVAASGLGDDVSAAVAQISPAVENYLTSAQSIIGQASVAPAAAVAAYPAFMTAFTGLEQAIPTVQDAVTAAAAALVAQAADEEAAAVRTVVVVGVLALLVLLALGETVTRSVTGPLARVDAVAKALAAGDLRVTSGVTSRDEVGRIAASVDRSVADLRGLLTGVGHNATSLSTATSELSAIAGTVVELAGSSSARTTVVADAAAAVSDNIRIVAAGSTEMGTAVREIAQNAAEVSVVAAQAVEAARRTTTTVAKLGDSSQEIAGVVKTIRAIAEQTNLLALNATIEAARAGDAGKGFAVVAGEVKDLAQETAAATKDITGRVEAIRADTEGAVRAIAEIAAIIARINDAQGSIAAAVEEQTATVAEMDRNVADAAHGADEIARSIASVAVGSSSTSEGMHDARTAIATVAGLAGQLDAAVSRFRV